MEPPNRKLGPYTLVSKIGLGGFGVVWLAEKRTAIATTRFALKLPRGEDIDLEAFKQEAAIWLQASGHPNVVPLIDADIYDEQVVIVSEFVPDGSLAAWLKQNGGRAPSVEVACELIDGVLGGLKHLHDRQIIHRDLKPENILMQRETPRLTDFGIARLLKTDSYSTNVSGTFAYMAPEAFDGKRNEQTDVWSAGVIFYQLLAGRLPYDQPDVVSLVGAVMRNDPPPLPGSVPDVVQRVAMKALQRDPANRYAAVADMRRDLIEAEHRLWLRRQEPEEIGMQIRESAPKQIYERPSQPTVPYVPLAETERFVPMPTQDMGNVNLAPKALNKAKMRRFLLPAAFVALVPLLVAALAGVYYWKSSRAPAAKRPHGPYMMKQTLTGHSGAIYAIAFSPDGKTLASGSFDHTVKLWDAQTGVLKHTLAGHDGEVNSVAFSPDGTILASASGDFTVKLWDIQTGSLRQTLRWKNIFFSVAFSPDGKTLAAGTYESVQVWDTQTWAAKQPLTGYIYSVLSIAFSSDGTVLATLNGDKTVKLLNVQTGSLIRTLTGNTNKTSGSAEMIAFSPDGKSLVYGEGGFQENHVRVWDVETGNLKKTLAKEIYPVQFSSDGRLLAMGNEDNELELLDFQTGVVSQVLPRNEYPPLSAAFSPDGSIMAVGIANTVVLWFAS